MHLFRIAEVTMLKGKVILSTLCLVTMLGLTACGGNTRNNNASDEAGNTATENDMNNNNTTNNGAMDNNTTNDNGMNGNGTTNNDTMNNGELWDDTLFMTVLQLVMLSKTWATSLVMLWKAQVTWLAVLLKISQVMTTIIPRPTHNFIQIGPLKPKCMITNRAHTDIVRALIIFMPFPHQ